MTHARSYSDPYLAGGRLGYAVELYDGSFEDWSLLHPEYPFEKEAAP